MNCQLSSAGFFVVCLSFSTFLLLFPFYNPIQAFPLHTLLTVTITEKQITPMMKNPNVTLRLFTELPTTLLEKLLCDPNLDAWDLSSLYEASYPLYPKLYQCIESAAKIILSKSSLGKYLIHNRFSTDETFLSTLRYFESLPSTSTFFPSSNTTTTCIWSCGRNDLGQGVRTSPSDINTLQPCIRLPNDNHFNFVDPPPHILSIAAGGSHSASITASGTLFVAGANQNGCLGLGDTIARRFWQPVISLKKVAGRISLVACGYSHTTVINSDGHLFVTGSNSKGQLGLGDHNHRLEFQPLGRKFHQPITMVSAGYSHTVCLLRDGSVYSCGDNSNGQLCLENNKIKNASNFHKIKLYGNFKVIRIACGPDSTMLLTSTNMILVTGKRPNGALSVIGGLGGPSTKISHLSVGEDFAILRTQSGIVGLSSYRKSFQIPFEFQHLQRHHNGTIDIDAGLGHYVVVCGDGTVSAAGKNAHGQVAAGEMGLVLHGSNNARVIKTCHVPVSKVVSVPQNYRVLQVAAGCLHSLYLLART